MCNPGAVMALQVVSTAFMAQSQISQGRFQKGVAEYNARVAENEAQETRRVGVEEENIQRRKTAELLSKQRTQLGASGIELGTGSALKLQEETVTLGEADALRIRSNFESRATALETSADLTLQQGAFAESSGVMGAGGTILGGAADIADTGVADKWFTPNSAATVPGPHS